MKLAKIGATDKNSVHKLTLSELDNHDHDLFIR